MNKLFAVPGFLAYLAIAFLNASVDLAHKITIQNVLVKSFDGDMLVTFTALINVMILLPFIFLFSPSGFLNDKYAKTKIIRIAAWCGVAISAAVLGAYLLGQFEIAFALTFILAAQSAVYSPAKYGIIKQIVGVEKLGTANGIIQALTIVAILTSSFVFSYVFESLYAGAKAPSDIISVMYPIGILLVVLSLAEALCTYKLPYFAPSKDDGNLKFEMKKYLNLHYLRENMQLLKANRNIWLSIIGLSIFWGISQVIVAAFPAHYKAIFNDDNALSIQAILAMSAIGIIAGSYVAGTMSKVHIEHGIVPIGALGMFLAVLTFGSTSNFTVVTISSFAFGFFGGMFIVPLNATIQFLAPEKDTGKIMAGNNFVQNIAMTLFLLVSIALVHFNVSTVGLFIFAAVVCFAGSLYSILQLPHLFTRILLLPFLKTGYRFNVEGLKNLPQTGGVLLLGNHISWIDWLVLQVASPRGIKFVMYRGIYEKWYLTWIFKFFKIIPIGKGSSKESILVVRECLARGEVVALFPEGHISYNGQINEFQRGFELIMQDLENVAIVPFYLRGLWGSTFSRADTYYKELTKRSGKRDILVAFGKPIYEPIDRVAMKQKVVELSFSSWESFINRQEPIANQWLNTAKSNLLKPCLSDSQGTRLNNLSFITGVLLFMKKLTALVKEEKHIGVLLPSSAAGAIVNMALLALGKVPINLNYTLSEQAMSAALNKADIKHVITSEKFLQKLESKGFSFNNLLQDKTIFAEDVGKTIAKSEKIRTLLTALFMPTSLIQARYFGHSRLQDTATILFSSGSEGEPKGIELTHKNLLSNIKQVSDLLNFRKDDVVLNSLPIFHSFGFTVTVLMPLCEGIEMVSVADPTDGAAIGKMAARHNVSILFGTSTFFRLYVRNKKLHPLMFQSVRMAVAGAEKLKVEVKDEFRLKFGIEIYEGYGATETAPVAAVNMPNILERETLKELTFNKLGTVGLPLPGTVIKIVDPKTLAELPTGEDGLIVIGGGQVMKGYLNDPEKTADVICEIDGIRYYKTGDKGHIDSEGFITIVDRYSRFAKIGGEMISLGAVEENIAKVLNDGNTAFIAVNIPDEKKGEAIVLLVKSQLTADEIQRRLKGSDLISIMQPSYIFQLDELPTLASGKADFKGAKNLALELVG
ncbi:acyl-[acyl-carrier-protein]-phospholipid O-acyltransferase/long-chain-fatty-acid--[acyl-carrier-protein] ligase [Cricetibacter osteomyelitidis]|uniref:Acyl-[acyl-carrier-protein]-phospholipid O-acyltransferase/long-chain-fatty-acid--[acyl-carrier-protein] ligase n=1 Tax=Cricetibacter osteomyelitidis TaxID=1521931 RepID=A0A4R2SY63_9PAST|nr:acyl-[ACP]--phospholipid O-acyltransferase [Cricetibacter osteomyelitidis]TCP93424.1 acyl-[acyl-carrier-protein]-phospholipid O-acyltransferase/long-chain-fatty-acid--[acyl-carrier-protein] ligase [Cricetibacter osteomyelitidis]